MKPEMIAEFGINNVCPEGGILPEMERYIKILALKGADYVKFQYFKTETMIKRDTLGCGYHGESQWEMIKKLELPLSDHIKLKEMCEKAGVKYLCTPFCSQSLDDLLSIGLREIKIASCDCGNMQMMDDLIVRDKKIDRVFLSTGMSTVNEVEASLYKLSQAKFKTDVLHCVSAYPTKTTDVNLNVIKYLIEKKCGKVGFSDHTLSFNSARVARALGAQIFERHVTPDPNLPGPDHAMSLPIEEFDEYVKSIIEVDEMLGNQEKTVLECESEPRRLMKKGLWFSKDVEKDHKISRDDIIVCRPLEGTLSGMYYEDILDKKTVESVKRNGPVNMENLI